MLSQEADVGARAQAVLHEARNLVRRGWSQGAAARDAQGNPVDATDPSARSWSLAGALEAAAAMESKAGMSEQDEMRAGLMAAAALAAATGQRGARRDEEDAPRTSRP
jgi:hypothetical protein